MNVLGIMTYDFKLRLGRFGILCVAVTLLLCLGSLCAASQQTNPQTDLGLIILRAFSYVAHFCEW